MAEERNRGGTNFFKKWVAKTHGDKYTVDAIVDVARDIYKGYGTQFPTRVVVIDKKPAGKQTTAQLKASDARELASLKGTISERQEVKDVVEEVKPRKPKPVDPPRVEAPKGMPDVAEEKPKPAKKPKKPKEPSKLETLRKQLDAIDSQLTEEEKDAVLALVESLKIQDRLDFRAPTDEIKKQLEDLFEDRRKLYNTKAKNPAGATITKQGKSAVVLMKSADIKTAIHEIGHVLEFHLMDPKSSVFTAEDREAVNEWLGAKEGKKWTAKQREDFAEGFVRFISEGTAPNSRLREVFRKIAEVLRSMIERGRVRGIEINDNLRRVFEKAMGFKESPVVEKAQIEQKVRDRKQLDESTFSSYAPTVKVKGAKPHPGELEESTSMAAIDYPAVTYQPSLPREVIEKGLLSEVQLEAVTMAGQAFEKFVTVDGKKLRRGFAVGDGTGVGKGRTSSGIMMDYFSANPDKPRKAVWVSKNKDLFGPSQDDWENLGNDREEVFSMGLKKNAISGGEVKRESGVLFVPYDTLKKKASPEAVKKGLTMSRVDSIVEWLGEDFDGVIIFDESHQMSKSIGGDDSGGRRGSSDPSDRAKAGIELQDRLPDARVVYVSATMATEASNLGYAQRLGLWGSGAPYPTAREFSEAIASKGVTAMEWVAQAMKAMGQYVARSVTYKGVKQRGIVHKLDDVEQAIYDKTAEAWQIVYQNMDKVLKEMEDDGSQRRFAHSRFYNSVQSFYNQLMISLMVPSLIEDMNKQLRDNKSVVIQLVNTDEAALNRALTKVNTGEISVDDIDIGPKDILMQFVQTSFPTAMMTEAVDSNGNVTKVPLERPAVDTHGDPIMKGGKQVMVPVEDPEAVAVRDSLLEDLSSITIPQAPIDRIIAEFGADMVAEITGRKNRIVNGEQEKARNDKKRQQEHREFNDLKRRILIFSGKGGTGMSYHASNEIVNTQQRVHYVLQPGWIASVAVQGLGRTNRTNQAHPPEYVLMSTDLPGHKRFVSTIAKRLGQLGALTKGSRDASGGLMFGPGDNLEGRESQVALGSLMLQVARGQIEGFEPSVFRQLMGFAPDASDTDVRRFLNRLLGLPVDAQRGLFRHFERHLAAAINVAKQDGTFDDGLQLAKHDSVIEKENREVYKHESGATARYIQLEVEDTVENMDFASMQKTLGNNLYALVRNKRSGKLYAATGQLIDSETEGGKPIKKRELLKIDGSYSYVESHKIDSPNFYETIPEDQAQKEWTKEFEEAPKRKTGVRHILAGVVYPVMDRIGKAGKSLMRYHLNDGTSVLGLEIKPQSVDGVLTRLNADKVKRDPKQLLQRVSENRITLRLANGWAVRRSRVQNEQRIEVVNPTFAHQKSFEAMGGFVETIASKKRFFIPAGDLEVFEKLIDEHPVTEEISLDANDDSIGAQRRPPEEDRSQDPTLAEIETLRYQKWANTGQTQATREAIDDLNVMLGRPDHRSHAELAAEADHIWNNRAEVVIERVLSDAGNWRKSGVFPSHVNGDLDIRLITKVLNHYAMQKAFGLELNDKGRPTRESRKIEREAQLVHEYYRNRRRDVGRELASIRDPLARIDSILAEEMLAFRSHRKLLKALNRLGMTPEKVKEASRDRALSLKIVKTLRTERNGGVNILYEWWVNSILSGIHTQVANFASTPVHIGLMATTRAVEMSANEMMAAIGKEPGKRRFTDFPHYLKAAFGRGLHEAFANARKTFTLEESALDLQSMTDEQFARHLKHGFGPDGHGKAEVRSHAIKGPAGKVIRIPTTLLNVIDDFWRTMVAHASAGAEAHRIATREIEAGEEVGSYEDRVNQLLYDMGSEAWFNAIEVADEAVMRQEGGEASQNIKAMIGRFQKLPLGRWLQAFKNFPVNSAAVGAQVTPLGFIIPLVKIMKGHRVEYRDMVYPAVGSLMMVALWGAFEGDEDDDEKWLLISGAPPEDRSAYYRAGNQPYSVRINGHWFSYSRIEPFSTTMAAIASSAKAIKLGRPHDAPSKSIDQFTDKTFIKNVGNIMKMIDRKVDYREVGAGVVTGFVPNLYRQASRAYDNEIRDDYITGRDSTGVAIQKLISKARLSELAQLDPIVRSDIWGRKLDYHSPDTSLLYRLIIPSQHQGPEDPLPPDVALAAYNEQQSAEGLEEYHPSVPQARHKKDGKWRPIPADIYSEFVQETGRRAYQYASEIEYSDPPKKWQIRKLKRAIEQARSDTRRDFFTNKESRFYYDFDPE